MIEKYDIVNVRLFLCVVRNNEPLPVLKNLVKMLSSSPLLLAQWPWTCSSSFLACVRLIKSQQSREDTFNGLNITSSPPRLLPHTQNDSIVLSISSTKRSSRVKQDSESPTVHRLVLDDAQEFC